MRRALLAGVTAVAITSVFGEPSLAACPEDIEAFEQRYQQAVGMADRETVLTDAEKADLSSLRTAARELQDAGDADACATVIYRANGLLESAIAPRAVAPETLVDRALTNAAGDDLGTVEEVLIDPMSGRIAYLLVEHGGFLGIGDELFAIPWAVVRYLPGDEERLLIDIDEAQLERAPRFSRTDRSPFGEREWALSVHSFYGVQPYWRFRGARAMLARTEAGAREDSGQEPAQDTGQDGGQESGQDAAPVNRQAGASAGGADGGAAAMRGDGEVAEASRGASDNDGEEAQLQTQLSELRQRLDRQSQTIDELKRIEQSFSEARASDQQVADQIEQLTAQLGEVQKQLDEVSVRLEQAGMREGAAAKAGSAQQRQQND
jgi:sporulation protein YlmC with PRC-barrel domain